MNTTLVGIVATESKAAAELQTELIAKVKAAFAVAKHHWLVTDENERFQGAIAGLILSVEPDVHERIKKEIALLNGMTQGNINGLDVEFEPLGLMQIWKEVK